MIFSNNLGTDGRGWRRALIIAAVCSLTVCVGTRFSLSLSAPGHMVKSMDLRSGSSKQHLDQDDTRFIQPVAAGVAVEPAVLYSSVTPPEPPRYTADFVVVLLNRPPPHIFIFFC